MSRNTPSGILSALLCALTSISVYAPRAAQAQDVQERASAAEAYDRGTAAYLAENYEAAARWFETADRLAPAAPALIQAVRAHQRAGDELRAATLALRLHLAYPDEDAAQQAAAPVLEAATRRYVRVEVSCDDCTLELDGTLLDTPAFFVDPGGDHALVAHFRTGEVSQNLRGSAGDVRRPSFVAPPETVDTTHPDQTQTPEETSSGISPALFVTSLVLTAGAGATLVWSGLDTNNDANKYEASVAAGDYATARQQLSNGRNEERRTNILIGVTAGLGLTTVIFAAVTNWGGSSQERSPADQATAVTGAALTPTEGGATVQLEGRF